MPNSARIQTDRRRAIRRLLLAEPAATQQSLVDALREQGFLATQSSVSRDLRELGAVKTALGYELPQHDAAESGVAEVAGLLLECRAAGPNLLVIRTAISAAQQVALALDQTGWSEIVGTVAGDDTVFVATAGAGAQRRLASRVERQMARA